MKEKKIKMIVACNYAEALMEAILTENIAMIGNIQNQAIEDNDITATAYLILISMIREARKLGIE